MKTLSTSPSPLAATTRDITAVTPNVVHGLAYGIMVSLLIWMAIAAIVYKLA